MTLKPLPAAPQRRVQWGDAEGRSLGGWRRQEELPFDVVEDVEQVPEGIALPLVMLPQRRRVLLRGG